MYITGFISIAIVLFLLAMLRHGKRIKGQKHQAAEDADQAEYLHGYDLLSQSERAGRKAVGPMATRK